MPLPLMAVWKVSFRTPTSASGCVLLRRFVAQAHSTVKQNLPWAVQSFAHIVGGDRACRPAQVVSEASSRDEEIVRHGGIEGRRNYSVSPSLNPSRNRKSFPVLR